MRLEHYINEAFPANGIGDLDLDDAVERIKRDCQPFLKEFKRPLYRGTTDTKYAFYIKNRRTNRRARNTNPVLSTAFDNAFKKIFGWSTRSEGVFVSGDKYQTQTYGMPYIFLPIGKYRYVWSPNVSDLFTVATGSPDVNGKKWNIDMNLWDGEKDRLVKDVPLNALTKQNYDDLARTQIEKLIKDNYMDKGYGARRNKASKLKIEAMFDCDKYYMLAAEYSDYIIEKIGME